MPDWTYQPLRPIASAIIGEHRTQRWALRFLATLVEAGGYRWIPRVFDHPPVPTEWTGRFGAMVPPSVARDAVLVLPVQGASIIEIAPVAAADVETVRRAATGRRCRVVARVDSAEVADLLAADVDEVVVGAAGEDRYLSDPDVTAAVAALRDPDAIVLARPSVLLATGPGWFNRVIEAASPASPPPRLADAGLNPFRWPGWLWGVLAGLGLMVAGVGAGAITLGPVLLSYDRSYLGLEVNDLRQINDNLVHFIQHDRISMAGNMIGLGALYAGLSWGGIRRGLAWARTALLISGLVAFLTLFYFVGTGFVDPLHTLVVVTLFPMLLAAVWNKPDPPQWRSLPDGPESERRRALWGQLLFIGLGAGLAVAGATISFVGLTDVFVSTDLGYLHTHGAALRAADPQLLGFIAHDRAGFGGALIGSGLAIALIALWGFRRGERWVWWSLLIGFVTGTLPALAVHYAIGYTTFIHLLPVYVLMLATAAALVLSRPYLTATEPQRP
ncbi:hypothetical protein [Mycolicibacterium peregrinum]|uniref:Uncharacterized protein n=1 Tax=Mycolicibacterium peregrinum TaxID=43304 RepID=A0A4Z0HRA6_MYCPR|nr:hypothetical protein [Mycolicibacterium peregrinum]TGB39548.1 hypothetical protein EJD98_20865 [Mycolicibacterium peregrinum]TGB39921.1 hypothetical protein EJD94_19370 [Mycolicibacterium peregrinum]